MCPSHCNTSVSVYGISLLRELSWAGSPTEWVKRWGTRPELWEVRGHDHAAPAGYPPLVAPYTSVQGDTEAPQQHWGHQCCPLHRVPLTLSSDAGAPWYLAYTRHTLPVTLQPCQHAEAAWGEGEKQETGRKASAAQPAAASPVAAGPVGCLIFGTRLDNPGASARLLQIIS